MMDPDETFDTAGWQGVCSVCECEIVGEAVRLDDEWAHTGCARKDEEDATLRNAAD